MKRPSCHHGVDGMTQVVLAALDGDKTSATLACSPCGRSANIVALSGSDADAPARCTASSPLCFRILMLHDLLRSEGIKIGCTRMRTVLLHLAIDALSRTPISSPRRPVLRVYQCLLCHLEMTRSNNVWAAISHTFRSRVVACISRGPALAQAPGVDVAAVPHADDLLLY